MIMWIKTVFFVLPALALLYAVWVGVLSYGMAKHDARFAVLTTMVNQLLKAHANRHRQDLPVTLDIPKADRSSAIRAAAVYQQFLQPPPPSVPVTKKNASAPPYDHEYNNLTYPNQDRSHSSVSFLM